MDSGDGNIVQNCKKSQTVDDEKDALGKSNGFCGDNVVAPMPVMKRSTHYNMNYPRRGIAIIFNHEHFHLPNLRPRAGTQTDCENFAERLKYLCFEVEVYNDLDYRDICKVIQNAAESDHSDSDCFLLCVMSHGDLGILYAKDTPYKPDNLWTQFTADKCPTLAGKPKMFFIQACQGDNLDKGITLARTETDGRITDSYRIPIHADFLIAYSTIAEPALMMAHHYDNNELVDMLLVYGECLQHAAEVGVEAIDKTVPFEGYYSWRNTSRGSWFIQALCDELKESQYESDMLTLLTFVSQRVAIDYESNVPESNIMHRQKQIPCVTSMLTRLIRFTPK